MHQLATLPAARRETPRPRTAMPLRLMLILLGVLSIGLPILLVVTAPPMPQRPAAAIPRPPVRVVPKAELPPVEPTAFVAVSRDDAKAFNATIPFSSAPILPARAFRIIGSDDSIDRATDCLTAGVLYEAGDDPVGQRAVGQVILNRLRHPAFPKSVCGVVFQGAERATGCQFTFTCDGALTRRYSDAAWSRARTLAAAALKGRVEKKVGTATHYHTDWVVPYWSSSLDKVSEVNTHLFFRWTGWWGTPPAFRGRYTGNEPLVPKLAAIAPSHAAAAGIAADGETPADAIAVDAVPAADLPQPMASDANAFLVMLDPRVPAAEYDAYAARICGDRPYCKLLAWTERADTPTTLPADNRVMEQMAFSFLRDRSRSFEKALWNCERFQRPQPTQCMRRQAMPMTTRPITPVTTIPGATPAFEPLQGVRRKIGTLAPTPAMPITPPPVRPTVKPPRTSPAPAP